MEFTTPESNHGQRLKGKVAIITGGARGIGAATAKVFALHGASVIIADILDDLGTNLSGSSNSIRYIHCDVSKESDVESAVKLALSWKGRLDIILNNAGISGANGSITNADMGQIHRILSVNLLGVIHGIKHASRAMIEGNVRGSIICTSSSAALVGGLASHAYTASKEAIVGLMRSAACELGVHGIRINCVSPHGVPSEMLLDGYRRFLGDAIGYEEVAKIVADKASLLPGRGGTVQDIAYAALFLASDESGFITAHNLVIDGGYTAANSNMRHMYSDQ